MGPAKEKPLYANPTDYEDDFEAWCFEQAELLRQRRFSEVDLPNVIEELESMGREQRRALESSYRLVISHLLKWQVQPQMPTRSWAITITRERANIAARERDNRSLAKGAAQIVEEVWRNALREAMIETDLPRKAFPHDCPYTPGQLRDHDWMPPDAPAGSQP